MKRPTRPGGVPAPPVSPTTIGPPAGEPPWLTLDLPAGGDTTVSTAQDGHGDVTLTEDGPTRDRPTPTLEGLPQRYEVSAVLGEGGGGAVLRAHDHTFGRDVALKVSHASVGRRSGLRRRFLVEARVTAQLHHPGIVAVHDQGVLADGRLWYSMKEVRGRTFRDLGTALHRAADPGGWRSTPDGWTLRRAVGALARASEAVGYAHSRGVVHRDLKPSNLMVGEFGEVVVMDWGLARLLSAAPDDDPLDPPDPTDPHVGRTRAGAVLGTPGFMAPEQVGRAAEVGPTADVYSLGTTLFFLLLGRPPFRGSVESILAQVQRHPTPDLRSEVSHGHPPLPDALVELCSTCMLRRPADRPPDGLAVAQALRDWLEGETRRDQARVLLRDARMVLPEAHARRMEAHELRRAATSLLEGVRTHDPEARKRPAWSLQDRAAELELQAAQAEARAEQAARRAVGIDDSLDAAHALLADLARARLEAAEGRGDPIAATLQLTELALHDRGAHTDFLSGEGRLTLHTQPQGATVEAFRYVRRNRRLQLQPMGHLGRTPLRSVSLPRGSYLLKLSHPRTMEVSYPVQVGRLDHWDGVPPGSTEPQPIPLPRAPAALPGAQLVSAGWARLGGDPLATDALSARRIWVPGFWIDTHPVTNAEWLRFVQALERAGEPDVQRWVPRCPLRGEDHPAWPRAASGRFQLPTQAEEPQVAWLPDMPVVRVSHAAVRRYAEWRVGRTGQAWRLPDELEWEKAGRGVDGRLYPWGDFLEETWCRTVLSLGSHGGICPVTDHPVDESPYGVRGLAGNVQDWCAGGWSEDRPDAADGTCLRPPAPGPSPPTAVPGGPETADTPADAEVRIVRGGGWRLAGASARLCGRMTGRPERAYSSVGVRLVCSVDDARPAGEDTRPDRPW